MTFDWRAFAKKSSGELLGPDSLGEPFSVFLAVRVGFELLSLRDGAFRDIAASGFPVVELVDFVRVGLGLADGRRRDVVGLFLVGFEFLNAVLELAVHLNQRLQ